jgi:hypothetical protein
MLTVDGPFGYGHSTDFSDLGGTIGHMGTGLGPTQRRVLGILATERNGITNADLSVKANLRERRCRAVVDSLVDRDEAIKLRHPGRPFEPRRVFLYDVGRTWLNNARGVKAVLDAYNRPPPKKVFCTNCGCPVPAHGRTF